MMTEAFAHAVPSLWNSLTSSPNYLFLLFLQLSTLWDFLGEVFLAFHDSGKSPSPILALPTFCSLAALDTVYILVISVVILLTCVSQLGWEVHFLQHFMLSASHST